MSSEDAAAPPAEDIGSKLEELSSIEQEVLRELLRLAQLDSSSYSQAVFHSATATLRTSLRKHMGLVDELEKHATECDRPFDQEVLVTHAHRHRAENATLLSSLRELTAKVLAGREENERDALFGGQSEGRGDTHDGKGGISVRAGATAARDVTESLRRTRQIMADELQRADNTLRTLDAQGKSLKDTLQEQRAVGSSLRTGSRALSKLSRRDFTDTILLLAAFAFFLLVVVHIAKKRVGFLFPSPSWFGIGTVTPTPPLVMTPELTPTSLADADMLADANFAEGKLEL